MAQRDNKTGRQLERPLSFRQFLFQEFAYAVADIRHKVVEEGWFGRAVTPHWHPFRREHDAEGGIHGPAVAEGGGIHGKSATIDRPDPSSPPPNRGDGAEAGIHGPASPAPESGIHGGASTVERPDPWMKQSGGYEALSEAQRRSAERSYDAWSTERNPEAARRYALGSYVEYVQGRWAEKDRPPETPARSRHPEEPKGVGMSFDELKASWGYRPDQPPPEKQPEKQPEPERSIDR